MTESAALVMCGRGISPVQLHERGVRGQCAILQALKTIGVLHQQSHPQVIM